MSTSPPPLPGARPRSGLSLSLAGGKTEYLPGDRLQGTAQWSEVGTPGMVEVRLFWFTSGRGTRDVQTIGTVSLSAAPQGREDFTFQLPFAPYSMAGRVVSLDWGLELVVQPGGHSYVQEFTLAPDGKEIQLQALDHGASPIARQWRNG